MTVGEYVTHFTQLFHYAPDNMDIEEKKQDWFLSGLNDGLAYTLEASFQKSCQVCQQIMKLSLLLN
jgi:hypothetical protein